MNSARLNRILINTVIISVCMTILPPPSGFIVGFLLVIGFNLYLGSKAPPIVKSNVKTDIWQQNAQRLQKRRQLQKAQPTNAQKQLVGNAIPLILGFAMCLTLALASYFQLGFIAFMFLFIVTSIATLLYSFTKIAK